MTAKVHWHNTEKTVLLQRFNDLWTLEDYMTISEKTDALLRTVNHPVDIIVDLVDSTTLTADLLGAFAPEGAGITPVQAHPDTLRRVVMIGAGALMRALLAQNTDLVPWRGINVEHADTFNAALTMIEQPPHVESVFTSGPRTTRPLRPLD